MKYCLKTSVWKHDKYTDIPDEVIEHGDYYTIEAAEKDIETVNLRLMSSGYAKLQTEIIEKPDLKPDRIHYCKFCHNTIVDKDLDGDNSKCIPIGKVRYENDGTWYSQYIKTGNNESTEIIVTKCDLLNKSIFLRYKPNFCPNCGRRLFENILS